MKKALVLGASGGMGYAIVRECIQRGIAVVAFARNREKLERLYRDESLVDIATGDALHIDDLLAASNGVDVIFNSVSILYQEWAEKLPKITRNVIEVAKKNGAKQSGLAHCPKRVMRMV